MIDYDFKVDSRHNLTWFYPKLCKYQSEMDPKKDRAFLDRKNENIPVLLYIHIPFCESFCSYCACFKENYYAFTKEQREQYADAVIKEIKTYFSKENLREAPVEYVLFGGGTPSVLENEFLEKILRTIREECNLSNLKGIALEGNVMSLKNPEKLQMLKENGVTRVSFGLQTFNESIRRGLNIKASVDEIYTCAENIHKVAFDGFAVDKMYNLPDDSMENLYSDLDKIVNVVKPDIIQYYRFNMFDNTVLANKIKSGQFATAPSPETEMKMSSAIDEYMMEKQYNNQLFINMYSNKSSIRNVGIEYSIGKNKLFGSKMVGVGAGAMSYICHYSYRNVTSVSKYIQMMQEGDNAIETGHIIDTEELENRVMTFFPNYMEIKISDIPNYQKFEEKIEFLKKKDMVIADDDTLRLTQKGRLWAGDISYFFHSDDEIGRMKKSYLYSLRRNTNPFNQDKMNISEDK